MIGTQLRDHRAWTLARHMVMQRACASSSRLVRTWTPLRRSMKRTGSHHMPSNQSPILHAVTVFAFVIHIAGGVVALLSGTMAAIARKGGALHRKAGTVFVVSMLIMAVFACYLAVMIPDQIINVIISIFTLYLISTSWLTVRRRDEITGCPEKLAMLVALCLWAPFAVLSIQLAAGLQPLFNSAVPLEGPVLVAIYGFTVVLSLAAIGDVRLVLGGRISGRSRIMRHLWRMCLGLTLAAGSGFTNGLARLLPGPYHVPVAFFFPQFIPLGLLIFWLIRLRFTGWYKDDVTVA
jgi:uncharacterized membrane protein